MWLLGLIPPGREGGGGPDLGVCLLGQSVQGLDVNLYMCHLSIKMSRAGSVVHGEIKSGLDLN